MLDEPGEERRPKGGKVIFYIVEGQPSMYIIMQLPNGAEIISAEMGIGKNALEHWARHGMAQAESSHEKSRGSKKIQHVSAQARQAGIFLA
jgi:hypothetical protein